MSCELAIVFDKDHVSQTANCANDVECMCMVYMVYVHGMVYGILCIF